MPLKTIRTSVILVVLLLACDNIPVTAPTEDTPGTLMKALADAVNNGDALAYRDFLTEEYIFTSTVNGSEVEYGRADDYEAVNAIIVESTSYGLVIEWQTIPTPPQDFTEFATPVSYQWFAETADFSYCAEGSSKITFKKSEVSEFDTSTWFIAAWNDDNTGETTSLSDFAPVTLGELKAAFE